MKQVTKYVCEKCGLEFNSYTACESHEILHIEVVTHEFHYKEKDNLPSSVTLHFPNEVSETYYKQEDL